MKYLKKIVLGIFVLGLVPFISVLAQAPAGGSWADTFFRYLNGTVETYNPNIQSIKMPDGTTGERPASTEKGQIRYNTTLGYFEGYDGSNWSEIGGSVGDMATATYDPAGISEQLVGLTAIQTLTNKTLTSPIINTPTGIVKGDVGLGNVENIAISSWTGSSNLETLGIIIGGTWNGDIIGDSFLDKTGNWTGTFDGQEGVYYLARANHTGTQTASTISNFDTEVSNNASVVTNTAKNSYPSADSTKVGYLTVTQAVDLDTMESDVATNNAKVSNATHTGEVTGATALTVTDNIVDEANLKLDTTPTNNYVLTADSTASGGMKWASGGGGGGESFEDLGGITVNTTLTVGANKTNISLYNNDGTPAVLNLTLSITGASTGDYFYINHYSTANTNRKHFDIIDGGASSSIGYLAKGEAGKFMFDGTNWNVVFYAKASVDGTKDSVVFGKNAYGSKGEDVIIGNNAYSKSADSVVIGGGAYTENGNYDVVIGYYTHATGSSGSSVVIGTSATASKKDNVSVGEGADSTGDYAIALGSDTTSSSTNTIAIGKMSEATSAGAIAIGDYSDAKYGGAVALGGRTVSSERGISLGEYSSTSQYGEMWIGGDFSNPNDVGRGSVQYYDVTAGGSGATEIFIRDNANARLTLQSSSTLIGTLKATAIDFTTGEVMSWTDDFHISNISGTTTLHAGASPTVLADPSTNAWTLTLSADDTNDTLKIEFTPDGTNTTEITVDLEYAEIRS